MQYNSAKEVNCRVSLVVYCKDNVLGMELAGQLQANRDEMTASTTVTCCATTFTDATQPESRIQNPGSTAAREWDVVRVGEALGLYHQSIDSSDGK
ncbi:hypothetical protein VTL71DRAFT_2319 [Oculimacula yallundae]|uniref:Uncharacterized protein n=1 Tax=Oculimacula yallundae TaxID=86028 RepID=A0ABR4CAT7_9HELO